MSLERRVPLNRATEGARRFAAQRSRLPNRSRRQAKKDREWQKVRAEVIERDQTCRAAPLVPFLPCWGYPEVHHLRNRSQGGRHEADGCVLLCSAHHEWVGMFPEKAAEVGLLILRPDAAGEPQ